MGLCLALLVGQGMAMDYRSFATSKGKIIPRPPVASPIATPKLSNLNLAGISRKIQRAKGPAPLGKMTSGGSTVGFSTSGSVVPLPSLFPTSVRGFTLGRAPWSPAAAPGFQVRTNPGVTVPLQTDFRMHWNPANGTPTFLTGSELKTPDAAAYAAAYTGTGTGASAKISATTPPGLRTVAYLNANRDLFRLENPAQELEIISEKSDEMGLQHAVFRQTFQGIPVWGHELAAHYRSNGELYSFNARYAPTPTKLGAVTYAIAPSQAIGIASSDLSAKTTIEDLGASTNELLGYSGPTAEKFIWIDPDDQTPHWSWHVTVRPNVRDNWYYFVDAGTGKILEKYNNTHFDGPATATATDLSGASQSINTYLKSGSYYLIDASRKIFNSKSVMPGSPLGALWTVDANSTDLKQVTQISSKNNTWSDAAAVSAQFNIGKVYDYYFNTFGRLGIDGAGSTVISAVHVTDAGGKMDNAFWTGKLMVYGDGKQAFKSLAAALDVAGHEMTHGVIQNTVNLEYKSQSGALNESLADFFGCMVDRNNWKIGEDIVVAAAFPSGALRDLENPHNGGKSRNDLGWQPATMSEYLNLTPDDDNGGVHVNSGIPNHAGYLVANAIGREKAEKIYYHLLDAHYLNSTSQFIDMRLAAIRSATDLYGETSPEVTAVKSAFDAVGLTDKAGTQRPKDVPAVVGQNYVAAVNGDGTDSSIYIAKSVIVDDTKDIVQLTKTQVFTGTGNPLTIPDDGSVLIFIDSKNAIRLVSDSGEELISGDVKWKSIAISPDGTKLAATTLEADSTIYIIDILKPDSSKAVKLFTPTTAEGGKVRDVVTADALDWSSTGEFLLYDAFHHVPQTDGDPIEYWDVNLLDVKNGIITQFYPSLPEGLSMGNPSFAQTSDLNFVFDMFRKDGSAYLILAADLFTGQVSVIDSVGTTLGYPRFSSDDATVVFQRDNAGKPGIQKVALAADKLTVATPPANYLSAAQRPQWFSIGKRPAWIKPATQRVTAALTLNPNPFHSQGLPSLVRFGLPNDATVDLSVYDMQGRKLTTLAHGFETAGDHAVSWDGRGQDGQRAMGGMLIFRLTAVSSAGKPMEITRKAYF